MGEAVLKEILVGIIVSAIDSLYRELSMPATISLYLS